MIVERADFDDLVTLVTQAPPWDKDRPRASASSCARSPRGRRMRPTRSSSAGRGSSPRRPARCRIAARAPSSPRQSGCSARRQLERPQARGERRAELTQVAKALPLEVGAALIASADGYTPRANAALDRAREELGATMRSRTHSRTTCPRRRRPPASRAAASGKEARRRAAAAATAAPTRGFSARGLERRGAERRRAAAESRRRRRRKPADTAGAGATPAPVDRPGRTP